MADLDKLRETLADIDKHYHHHVDPAGAKAKVMAEATLALISDVTELKTSIATLATVVEKLNDSVTALNAPPQAPPAVNEPVAEAAE